MLFLSHLIVLGSFFLLQKVKDKMVLITFKWLRSVILLVTVPGLIKSQSNDTKLSTWYKKIKDPAFECPPLASTRVAEGPEVFTVVDCDAPGARYDYNYKVKRDRQTC